MASDAARMRQGLPTLLTDLKRVEGMAEVVETLAQQGGLGAPTAARAGALTT
jgi:Ni2+-binding GTPase involved in maturation of urease and hydrogenase